MTSKRGLVLAGGGLAGIAWEIGILRGIEDESAETATALLASDVVIGTSAGSAVAAQLGSGRSLDELYERQITGASKEITPGVDIEGITELFISALSDRDATTAQKLQRIGQVAQTTATVPEAVRRDVIAQRLPSHDWPERDLRITAIDIGTGELVVFDRGSGVELVDAVAASCAVPGAWPPVTIGEHRYMDGGVGSTMNLKLAFDCGTVVVLVPSGKGAPSPFGPDPAVEVDAFPGRSLGVFADDDALSAFGPNPLDPACREPSARAGRAQGRRVAAEVADFLAG
ncbi:patatin-like phospholipase family protein [Mycobacterium sp. ITM-2016-00318]|uniref:patatin-like phospholipase family protein n=1 Tax=Mycobacterium sp. ITM-2016-00318 TaxID=2099693 RepID=UPI000CF8F4F6|nr:patatin-like phospholipase family protein [Mycobacterium sp. ITM-2016-00318]WNG91886.1 patatin-like phospholipase family protein [Mycobacterium sp. ITM-2016-00318]